MAGFVFRKHAEGAEYDGELEKLMRVAAKVGLDRGSGNVVNYTTLLVGFALCDDAASRFLQGNSFFKRKEVLASRKISLEEDNGVGFVHRALTDSFTVTPNPFYSPSAGQMLDLAASIARTVTGGKIGRIGTRHLLAAFLFRNPPDHADDLRRWGLDAQGFATSFPRFVEETWPQEAAGWRSLFEQLDVRPGGDPTNARRQAPAEAQKDGAKDDGAAPVERVFSVATFGPDDPSSERRDLLNVKDEARAFARIAAARSTRLPVSIGVFGEWGSGKTFFMDRMSEHVEKLSGEAANKDELSLFLSNIVQIKFNAWHYIETNLWASLVEYIFTELDRKLQQRKSREEVERLFEQLSTSRLLKLEAIDDLIVKRRERKAAQKRLDGARRDYEAALLRQSAVTSSDFWNTVFTLFAQKNDAGRVDELAKALGIKELSKSAASLNEVLKEAETEAGRARVLNRAMVAKLGQGRWIAAIVVGLILVPAAVVGVKDAVGSALNSEWIKQVNDAVLALSGMVAAAGALIGKAVGSARSALTELEGFRTKLDEAVKQRTEEFKKGSGEAQTFAQAERDTARLKNELEQAERKFAEADRRSDEILRDYQGATAHGRLNAFIRDKLASGDYAKHLGLIATIRKDFDQLAKLMADVRNDKKSQEEYQSAQQQYRERLKATLDRALKEETLSTEEVTELGKVEAAPEQGLFNRIILYIDDLDRCPPDKVVDVLQAIHLLLYFPLFVVVVAVDARWVSRSLREQFPDLLTENIIAPWQKRRPPHGTRNRQGDGEDLDRDEAPDRNAKSAARPDAPLPTAATSHDYLEKIFQIPYWVRPMDRKASMDYVKGIAEPDVRRGPAALDTGQHDAVQPRPQDPIPEAVKPDASQPESGGVGSLTPIPRVGGSTRPPAPPEQDAAADEDQRGYAAKGMVLSGEEGDFLEALAPFVGSTPRRGLRFVNVYRLVKTSLPEKLQLDLQDVDSHLIYRALITQLAIVTGAPHVSWAYFKVLESAVRAIESPDAPPLPGERRITSLGDLCHQLEEIELANIEGGQKTALLGALHTLHGLNIKEDFDIGTELIKALHRVAPIARRYSFIARPN